MKITSKNLVEGDYLLTPDGLTWNINDGHEVFLVSANGYGLPPLEYHTQRGPFQHGETALDYRLRPRIVQIIITSEACNRQDYWDLRKTIIDYVRPNRQATNNFLPSTLRKVLPDGSFRDLDVFIRNGPSFAPRVGRWDEFGVFETLQFVAHDPTFYNPTAASVPFSLAALNELVFPITFDPFAGGDPSIIFGGTVISGSQDITYLGNWLSYPTISVTGPISNLEIRNSSTDEIIKLDYIISAGEVVTFDLSYGQKTVTNAIGTNLIGAVTPDSDLATFHIAPAPEVTGGINTIGVSGSDADPAATQVHIAYNDRYIGI